MKASKQLLTCKEPPPSSTTSSASSLCAAKLRRVCQSQIEQLAAQLPIVTVWLVYQDADKGKRHLVVRNGQAQSFEPVIQSYLESEAWLADCLPFLKVGELAVVGSLNAYVCLLGERRSHPEYLLLWTYEPLSEFQQQQAIKQAELLANYMALCQTCSRQQAEIQLLEQVVRRAEHQLRNPLALITLYAENLYRSLPTGSLQEQAVVIRETVKNLASNLTDLLYCGQQAKLRVAPVDLRILLMESIRELQPWIQEKNLQVRYPEAPFIITVDRGQIKQVFDNLLNNAVHFSPPGSIITCNWHIFRQEALFEICDRGPGLAEEDLKHAFTPFYSRRPGGTGLGLAIAKKVILDHQGSIWVQNLPDGGAQFSFTVPRVS